MQEADESMQASTGKAYGSPEQGQSKSHISRDLQDFDQISLLHLQPRSRAEKIECTIKLAKISEQPQYEALSYTWGPATPIHSTLINRADFDVREISNWRFSISVWSPNQEHHGSMLYTSINVTHTSVIIGPHKWRRSTSKQRGSLYG